MSKLTPEKFVEISDQVKLYCAIEILRSIPTIEVHQIVQELMEINDKLVDKRFK